MRRLLPSLRRSPFLPSPLAVKGFVRPLAMTAASENFIQTTAKNGQEVAEPVLNLRTINPRVLATRYAVRGELALQAEVLQKSLASRPSALPSALPSTLPFDSVISCNIGNPQQLGQTPITFYRQVLALVECHDVVQRDEKQLGRLRKLFPADAIERAEQIVRSFGAIGAYTSSKGNVAVRRAVAEFIRARDGFATDPELIFLTSGASEAIALMLELIVADPSVGVMVPIPQYPLYVATLSRLGASVVPYYLNEADGWSISRDELARSIGQARLDGVAVRAICIINPGNPTGNCFSEQSLREVIEFCRQERLVLLSDEVYQANCYEPSRPFASAKKMVSSMGKAYEGLELVSFHSTSKGLLGECGRRGGYMECHGIDPAVVEEIYKLKSVNLCSSVQGQIMVNLMVDPPRPGDPSFRQYRTETVAIYDSLKRRAKMLEDAFNAMEGVSCQPAQGAMYLFPKLSLPDRFVAEAETLGKLPDEHYAMSLLNATGVCVVPGSGFGQVDGTHHIRLTFLPSEEQFASFIERIAKFHAALMEKYS